MLKLIFIILHCLQSFTPFTNYLRYNSLSLIGFTLPGDINWPTQSTLTLFKNSIQGSVYFKGDQGYNPKTWNTRTNIPKPAVIVSPINSDDIKTALLFAKQYNIRLSIMSTGHHQDIRNIADNSIHLDLSKMKSLLVDTLSKTMKVGTGITFGEITREVKTQSSGNLVAMTGADTGVGPYGWAAAGGHGYLTRLNGLGVDALINVELMIADGTIINLNSTENTELFRAIRGGAGSSFGIAISMTFNLFDTPSQIRTFNGYYSLSDATAELFGNFMINAPNEVHGYYLPSSMQSLPPYVQIVARCIGNNPDCGTLLQALNINCIAVSVSDCNVSTYSNFYDFVSIQGTNVGNTPIALYGSFFNSINIVEGLKAVTSFISNNIDMTCSGNAVLGGVSAGLDPNQATTAVLPALRESIMSISCVAILGFDNSNDARLARIKTLETFGDNVLKNYSKYIYWNEPNHNFPQNDWKERYWGSVDNYNRILQVKLQYDPTNFFTCYHCIGYDLNPFPEPEICPIFNCTCSNNANGDCNSQSYLFVNMAILILAYIILL